MTNFAIPILFLLLASTTVASARLSLLRMAPVHADKHSIAFHSEFGHSLYHQDSAAALRELTGYFEDYLSLSMPLDMSMSMPMDMSMSMSMPMILPPSSVPIDTTLSPRPPLGAFGTVQPSPAPTISNTAPPTMTGGSNDATAGTDADTVISPGIEEGDNASSTSSVTPGQIVIISLVVCAALAIGLLVLHRNFVVQSSSASIDSVSSGSDGSVSSDAVAAWQVDDYMASRV